MEKLISIDNLFDRSFERRFIKIGVIAECEYHRKPGYVDL